MEAEGESENNLQVVKLPDYGVQDDFIHCEQVSKANLIILEAQKCCDVTFVVGDEKKEMKCHKIFLISRSPVFAAMFSEIWDSSESIELPEVEPETFQLFLKFVYGDVFTESISEAVKMLQLGDKYDVKPLIKKCEELMSQDIQLEDAIETFKVARRYSLKNLMEDAGDFITCSFAKIAKHGSFKNMDEETLMYLLKRDDLPLSETDLFHAVLRWASDKMEQNGSYSDVLKNIIPLVRFPLMTAQEFATYVFPTQILNQKNVVDLFLYFSSDETQREDVAKRLEFSTCPRYQSVCLDFYEPINSVVYNQSYETLVEKTDHEDILEISFEFHSERANDSRILKIYSLRLEGKNFDSLRQYWPSNRAPDSNVNLEVSVEKIDSTGAITTAFIKNCELASSSTTEIFLHPTIQVMVGCKYNIKVKFQNTLVINTKGQRSIHYGLDMLSRSQLKSSLSKSNCAVNLNVKKPPQSRNPYNTSYYHGPLGLHVVRGLELLVPV